VAATGTGISSFAWLGENDVFAIIHSPAAEKLGRGSNVDAAAPGVGETKDFAAMSAQKLKVRLDVPLRIPWPPAMY
jgi:hypothetical protein